MLLRVEFYLQSVIWDSYQQYIGGGCLFQKDLYNTCHWLLPHTKVIENHIMLFVHQTTFIFIQNPPLTDMVKALWNRILSLPCGPWIPDHSGFGIVSGDRAASSRLNEVNCWIRRTRNNDASLYANYTNQLLVNLSWGYVSWCWPVDLGRFGGRHWRDRRWTGCWSCTCEHVHQGSDRDQTQGLEWE